MRKFLTSKLAIHLAVFALFAVIAGTFFVAASYAESYPLCQQVDTGALGFKIPSLADILTFVIRIFFVIAGLAALIFMLLGAFAWITSGGDKEAIDGARQKIQAAVVGLIMIIVVLALIWTLETIVFRRAICLGISCPMTIPGLVKTTGPGDKCTCVDREGKPVKDIDPTTESCNP